jgi:hypothetical protein
MTVAYRSAGIIAALASVLAMTACHKSANPKPERTAHVLLTVTPSTSGATGLQDIAVPLGTLDVQVARIYVGQFTIQENSGGEGNAQDSGDEGGSGDLPDILVAGPFDLDIAGGAAFIDTVSVYPGVFRKTDVAFTVNGQAPFNGMSILISGSYTPQGGSVVPFALRSGFTAETECGLVGDSIVVNNDTLVPVSVSFGVPGWLENLDFAHAQVTNDTIFIDSTHNTDLLAAFESGLSNSGGENGEN